MVQEDVTVDTTVAVTRQRGNIHASVRVQLCTRLGTLAADGFKLANCDDVKLAQDAATVFVVGWANDLRAAAQQQVGSIINEVEISAKGDGPGKAKVKLSIRLPSYESSQPAKTYMPILELPSISSIAEAEEAAKLALQNLLAEASHQCETRARDAFQRTRGFLSAFGRLPDWLTRAREVLRLP